MRCSGGGMGSGGEFFARANEDLYEMLGTESGEGRGAVVINYCETDSSLVIPSFCVVGLVSASPK